MRVHIRTPYSVQRNLGKAYNEEMALIPDGDRACFIDGECMFLTSNFGTILHEYANNNPMAILTCWISRIHPLASGQLFQMQDSSVETAIRAAEAIKDVRTTFPIIGSVSGTLMVIPKRIWNDHNFTEVNAYRPGEPNILGVDNHFTNKVRQAGIPVLRMNGMLIYHQYRLLTNSKQHLL